MLKIRFVFLELGSLILNKEITFIVYLGSMRRYFNIVLILISFFFTMGLSETEDKEIVDKIVETIEYNPWYHELIDSVKLSKAALFDAYQEFLILSDEKKITNDSLITIIDFSKSSAEERFFVIDIKNQKLLYHLLVAHGMGSGEEFPERFSNRPHSHMSSLGVYRTSNTYMGKHGYSLRLDGLEKGLNDNARKRAIVIHGAKYVDQDYIMTNGRLGRSFGCPALPIDKTKEVIDLIKDGSCLFIYHPSYTFQSLLL